MNEKQLLKKIEKYKNSARILKIGAYKNKRQSDPLIHYYQESTKKQIYPKALGFHDQQANQTVLKMDNNFISNEYMDAFCRGVATGQKIQEIRLHNCMLTSDNAIKILDAMRWQNIKVLDYSLNPQLNE